MNSLHKHIAIGLCSVLLFSSVACDQTKKTKETKETTTVVTSTTEKEISKTTESYSNFVIVKTISGPITLDIANKSAKTKSCYFDVVVNLSAKFDPMEIEYISENPNIATIEFESIRSNEYLSCKVTGKLKGTTNVYIRSKDGAIESEKIKVTVLDTTPTPKPTSKPVTNKSNKKSNKKTTSNKSNKKEPETTLSQEELLKQVKFNSFTYTAGSVNGMLKAATKNIYIPKGLNGDFSAIEGPGISYQMSGGTHYITWKYSKNNKKYKQKVVIYKDN